MTTIAATTAAQTALKPSMTARAADGDYLSKGVGHEVKDADGDYKPTAVAVSSAASPAGKPSASVQAALASLVKGG